MPHGREGEGLHLPSVPEAVERVRSDAAPSRCPRRLAGPRWLHLRDESGSTFPAARDRRCRHDFPRPVRKDPDHVRKTSSLRPPASAPIRRIVRRKAHERSLRIEIASRIQQGASGRGSRARTRQRTRVVRGLGIARTLVRSRCATGGAQRAPLRRPARRRSIASCAIAAMPGADRRRTARPARSDRHQLRRQRHGLVARSIPQRPFPATSSTSAR